MGGVTWIERGGIFTYRVAHSADGPASDARSRCGRGVEYSGSYRINCVRGALHSLIAACIVAGAILLPYLVSTDLVLECSDLAGRTAAAIVLRCVRHRHPIAWRDAGGFFEIAAAWWRSGRNVPSMRTRRSWTSRDPPIGFPSPGISLEVRAAFPVRRGLDAYAALDASGGTFSETKREVGLLSMMQAGVIRSDYATLANARRQAGAVHGAMEIQLQLQCRFN